MEPRRLLADLTATAPQPTTAPLVARNCRGLNLPIGGVLSMPNGELVTLTAAAAFKPVCTPVTPPAIIANGGGGSVTIDDKTEVTGPNQQIQDPYDPFYASTFPQCYALAATTVVAYMLVIMLFITPRSFLDGGVVVLGRRGFTNGGAGPTIGGRPWLQKVAALTVAISLTIASVATFDVAEEQYSLGVQNAAELQIKVLGGNELKIIRIISNTFLWLAQAQTLIRLFPRQREKVMIKWTAFALITLDVIFQSLNSFQYEQQGVARPGSFQHAVPALSYLFALSLGVLYAAWVIYYSLLKKRYAFWHPQMKNMLLVAVLSLLSILIPIVFFISDVIQPEFTGWGEYVRWVGAAAASVIVWEWVERIEALEREEKKDGILGREVFDGDDMLEMTDSDDGFRKRKKGGDDGDKGTSIESGRHDSLSSGRNNRWPTVTALRARYRSRSGPRKAADPTNTQSTNHDRIRFLQPPLWPARPAPAVTPISRTDTASAASTVYAIRYGAPTETTSRTPPPAHNTSPLSQSHRTASGRASHEGTQSEDGDTAGPPAQPTPALQEATPVPNRWRALAGRVPFRSPRQADEERAVPASEENMPRKEGGGGGAKWDLRARVEEFAAMQAERFREKFRTAPDTDSLPVTVIPAPPRQGAALAQLLEEEELEARRAAAFATDRRSSSLLRSMPLGDELPVEPSRQQLRPIVTPGELGPVARISRRLSVPLADTAVSPQPEPGAPQLGISRSPQPPFGFDTSVVDQHSSDSQPGVTPGPSLDHGGAPPPSV
ncbi:PalH-domain-containing protein [Parathielavia appendiculata]|uniref:PalH-domain-containing protein n=1 Tax=Parathielavia appendiculata TaxID=2587402 RepID=A0AAN6TZ94_9PEZI|nr:PalH-domain-containing protein [Parathielavia appendiculata]